MHWLTRSRILLRQNRHQGAVTTEKHRTLACSVPSPKRRVILSDYITHHPPRSDSGKPFHLQSDRDLRPIINIHITSFLSLREFLLVRALLKHLKPSRVWFSPHICSSSSFLPSALFASLRLPPLFCSVLAGPLVPFKCVFTSKPSVNQTDLKRRRAFCSDEGAMNRIGLS